MVKRFNPDTVHAPLGTYSHTAEVAPGARMLYVAGQVGIAPDGTVLEGIEAQAEQVYRNIFAVLEAAGMGPENLVKTTTFLTDPDEGQVLRTVRERMLDGIYPPNTLVFITRLARPELRVEIEAVAAEEV